MGREAEQSNDPLVTEVRKLLKSSEPRPDFVNARENGYGFKICDCPICGDTVRPAAYNHHWTYYHGERFWKEKALIARIRGFDEKAKN